MLPAWLIKAIIVAVLGALGVTGGNAVKTHLKHKRAPENAVQEAVGPSPSLDVNGPTDTKSIYKSNIEDKLVSKKVTK